MVMVMCLWGLLLICMVELAWRQKASPSLCVRRSSKSTAFLLPLKQHACGCVVRCVVVGEVCGCWCCGYTVSCRLLHVTQAFKGASTPTAKYAVLPAVLACVEAVHSAFGSSDESADAIRRQFTRPVADDCFTLCTTIAVRAVLTGVDRICDGAAPHCG